jgi:hypothetical protein
MLCVKNGIHTDRKMCLSRTRQWRRLRAFRPTYQGKRHKMFRSLARQEETGHGSVSQQNSRLALEASVALTRLDERLAASPAPVRAGWIARGLIYEAVASLRLDGQYLPAHDLLLLLNNALDRTPDQDTGRAVNIHSMLSTLSRRKARHLFSPRKVMALAQLRLRDNSGRPVLPAWLESRQQSPKMIRAVLEDALHLQAVASWKKLPPVEASAKIIRHWRDVGAAECIGAAHGRVLAMAWLPRTGMMSGYYLLPSVGFLGHAHEYRPDLDRQWPDFFLKACLRSAEWGFKLHGHLTAAHRRLQDAASAPRPSHLPALADLLIATPVLSASQAGTALRITSHSARAMLSSLEKRGLIHEVTGRASFRFYTPTPFIHLR